MLAYNRSLPDLDDTVCIQQAQANRYESMQWAMACALSGFIRCVSRCRRTVDHTGPYVRMLLERLRNPKSLTAMPPMPTAAGALEVPLTFLASNSLAFPSLTPSRRQCSILCVKPSKVSSLLPFVRLCQSFLTLQILPPAGYISQPATGCASKFVNLSWQKVMHSLPLHLLPKCLQEQVCVGWAASTSDLLL